LDAPSSRRDVSAAVHGAATVLILSLTRHKAVSAVLAVAVAALLALGGPSARAASLAETPHAKALYQDGPSGRYLLGGRWLYRPDPGDVGIASGFFRTAGTTGWRPVTVPNAFNAGDFSQESFNGSVGWYRKDFTPPSLGSGLRWAFRFESVNYRARVWLNGRPLGAHAGAYLPFELATRAVRHGVNRLVVRVDSRRLDTDVPPRRALWWNWGGILREVYLRKVGRLDTESVQVTPELRDANRRATLAIGVRVRNGTAERRGSVRALVLGPGLRRGKPVPFSGTSVSAFSSHSFEAKVTLERPRLWWPADPRLYRLQLQVGPAGRPDQTYSIHFGVRTFVKDRSGHVLLNGRPIQLRGAGMHEDSLSRGAALSPWQRAASIRDLKALGANFVRAHYPLHPSTLELCDREGIVVWDEIPFYQISPAAMAQASVRRRGLSQLRQMIARDRNHPSVIAYSIGNELGEPSADLADYIHRAARLARAMDPSRLLALDIGFTGPGVHQPAYDDLDALGINEYFGWTYLTVAALGPKLDALRRTYPHLALFVTEFGAEANRHGAPSEPGTYEFQEAFLRAQLDVIAHRPYLNGALIWALREFAVTPGWDGGNPMPSPPFHKKGLIDLNGWRKPAFDVVAALYRATPAVRAK
jgi:beta-glucuronidase